MPNKKRPDLPVIPNNASKGIAIVCHFVSAQARDEAMNKALQHFSGTSVFVKANTHRSGDRGFEVQCERGDSEKVTDFIKKKFASTLEKDPTVKNPAVVEYK